MARKFKQPYKKFVREASNTFVNVKMDGAEGLEEMLLGLGEKLLTWGGGAMFEVANNIMNVSKDVVPVGKTGNLKNSGTTHPPEMSADGTMIEVIMSYGGPSVDYALVQHDTPNPPFSHKKGQSWKYLENPTMAAAPDLGPAIAAAITGRIARGGG